MAINDDIDTRVAQLDAATTEVANDLQALRDEIAAGEFVSPEDKSAILAKLDSRIERLVQLGQDPVNPVPPAALQPGMAKHTEWIIHLPEESTVVDMSMNLYNSDAYQCVDGAVKRYLHLTFSPPGGDRLHAGAGV